MWATVRRGNASFNTLTGQGNQSIVNIGSVGKVINATSIIQDANSSNPSKQFAIVTAQQVVIEIWVDSIESNYTPLKVSATVSPYQSAPILDIKEAYNAQVQFTRGGPGNSAASVTLPLVPAEVPARLECDSDVYSWCTN